MTNKTISLNPDLLSVGRIRTKTKKNIERKQRPTQVPLISPNVLKKQFLKRIKEHKNKETEHLEVSTPSTSVPQLVDMDEFADSIEYLQTLSNNKKKGDEKERYEMIKQQKRAELERKTVKNYQTMNNALGVSSVINVDLPDELKQPLITINTSHLRPSNNSSLHLKQDSVPYGILKNGTKPTYKEWIKTQKNYIVTDPKKSLVIQDIDKNKIATERERRLNNLKERMKQKQHVKINTENNVSTYINTEQPISTSINIPTATPITGPISPHITTPISAPLIPQEVQQITNMALSDIKQAIEPLLPSQSQDLGLTKQITKKTIKKKYTLGKSQMKKTVGILLKDRNTRKKILFAQRELKKKPINEIKTYLREHNLIKLGSTTPSDVLKKLYEASMLSGEVTNTNSETLLYNLLKEDKEV